MPKIRHFLIAAMLAFQILANAPVLACDGTGCGGGGGDPDAERFAEIAQRIYEKFSTLCESAADTKKPEVCRFVARYLSALDSTKIRPVPNLLGSNHKPRLAGPAPHGDIVLNTTKFKQDLADPLAEKGLIGTVIHEYFIKARIEGKDEYTWSRKLAEQFSRADFTKLLGIDTSVWLTDMVTRYGQGVRLTFDDFGCVATIMTGESQSYFVTLHDIDPDHIELNGGVLTLKGDGGKPVISSKGPDGISGVSEVSLAFDADGEIASSIRDEFAAAARQCHRDDKLHARRPKPARKPARSRVFGERNAAFPPASVERDSASKSAPSSSTGAPTAPAPGSQTVLH